MKLSKHFSISSALGPKDLLLEGEAKASHCLKTVPGVIADLRYDKTVAETCWALGLAMPAKGLKLNS